MSRSEKNPVPFLPATAEEMRSRGWDYVDIILVTGDAYIDHPSFGIALIGRLLEDNGYRVAVLSQPRHDSPESFKIFGPPRLFWGITSGNLDSIVSNYSGNGKVRDRDDYSPNGNPYFGNIKEKKYRRRPDRATILYTSLARNAYPGVPVVLGGIEASLRRFVHFDYQQNKLRASVLTDSKADLLVYGMGEKAVVEAARRIASGLDLHGIQGTCVRLTAKEMEQAFADNPDNVTLSSWEDIVADKSNFMSAEIAIDKNARAFSEKILCQKQQAMWVVQYPQFPPLATVELDRVYSLPYTRQEHPVSRNVPAYQMICHSITIVRGCSGNCSFCAITRHQGPVITSRSEKSVLEEAELLSSLKNFKGTITDLGGPTANLFGVECGKNKCSRHDCLVKGVCPHLIINEKCFVSLLDKVKDLPRVKHAHVSSGLRMELLLKTPELLERLLAHHVPGAMKIAPEHTEDNVLRLMHKQPNVLAAFLEECNGIASKLRKNIHFTPYFMSAHPGCTLADMQAMGAKINTLGLNVRSFQDFTPTPGTLSTAMYVSGIDRDTLKPVFVPSSTKERRLQRHVLETIRKKKGTHK
ncbi:MAG: YgiQ family radical SAM protein [Desulfobulbaceae bacterium]|uniref:YgiQ family radical SAM protein n=1 Tax=Candidatus Desulfobia pelagia TaxID=2841692 RepID=A0A8J6NBA9_9BACT|nr:YgiQ family radical SAM protein [Candidatus Desulfobia pelagia]